jgi:hypothetical protein
MMVTSRNSRIWLVLGLLLLAGTVELAQVVGPASPRDYRVVVRYRIYASVNQRLPVFFALTRHLEGVGFHKDPGPASEPEDQDQVRMTGTIKASAARRILEDDHVRAILLMPAGFELKPGDETPLKVQIDLTKIRRQSELAGQVAARLESVGFHEATGYDSEGFQRIVGRIPANRVELLLEDLRWQTSGWLVPAVSAAELPYPIRGLWPVRVVEILPDPPGATPFKELAAGLAVPTAEVSGVAREILDLKDQDKPRRLELAFAAPPAFEQIGWQTFLAQTVPGVRVEGRLGEILTLRARPDQAASLAQLPGVLTVRLPRPAGTGALPPLGPALTPQEAVHALGFDGLRSRRQPFGRKVRLAIIGADFRGYESLVGKGLPEQTRYIDMTAECEPEIEPAGYGADSASGSSTPAALAAALAAPDAEITLVRIAPDMPAQALAIARYVNGEHVDAYCLDQRSEELAEEDLSLRLRRDQLIEERKAVLDQFGQDKATVDRREALFKKEADLDKWEERLAQRRRRYLKLMQDLLNLKGVDVVANTLTWDEGYAVDGGSGLTRYLDGLVGCRNLWFQAGGDTRGQVWAGVFLDANQNGVMEFAPSEQPLRPGRWTPELNFLAWQGAEGTATPELPEGKIRISLQWREPHDSAFRMEKITAYRQSLADLRLVLLRQRDPSGQKLPTDDLEVVARTAGLPARLSEEASSAVYEQVLEFTVPAAGRYALRVEGRIPERIRPAVAPELPVLRQRWELQPRLFVSAPDHAADRSARPVFLDYATDYGNLGMPADALAAWTVGAIDSTGKREAFAAGGPALGQVLHFKPELATFDRFQLGLGSTSGSEMAAAFAAGVTAHALSAGVRSDAFLPGPGDMLPAPLRIRAAPLR